MRESKIIFTSEDLERIDPAGLEPAPITYTAVLKLVREYDLNPVGLAVECLNLGYYLGSLAPDTDGK